MKRLLSFSPHFSLMACILCTANPAVRAQIGPTFSIDFQGPTAGGPGPLSGFPDSFSGLGNDEGSILTTAIPDGSVMPNPPAFGPLPPPGVLIGSIPGSGAPYGDLVIDVGLHGAVEVDALSYGRDAGLQLFFSVDEFAVGSLTPPDVFTQGGFGKEEASADVFKYNGPAKPSGAVFPGPGNTAFIDGDGVAPFGGPGLGLIEPNPFSFGAVPDRGDNLDALDVNTRTGHLLGPVFFSMDARFADPFEGGSPPNTGTAPGNGFSSGDVVVTSPFGPFLYAPAGALGLDSAGFDSDDLDALALFDDGAIEPLGRGVGIPFYSPDRDRILFSVRRGSAIIGTPDSLLGLRIEEGDVLAPPTAAGLPPAIFITAEALGLATVRSGTTAGMNAGDELDALDILGSPCDLNFDGDCDVADINTMYHAGDLVAGVPLPGPPADYDLNNDLVVDNSDLTFWLTDAATHNGFATAHRRGDTELDRDVDIIDFNNVVTNFDPIGVAGPHPWEHGNFDGDLDVDITDFGYITANFAPEPSALVLVGLAMVGMCVSQRRRRLI